MSARAGHVGEQLERWAVGWGGCLPVHAAWEVGCRAQARSVTYRVVRGLTVFEGLCVDGRFFTSGDGRAGLVDACSDECGLRADGESCGRVGDGHCSVVVGVQFVAVLNDSVSEVFFGEVSDFGVFGWSVRVVEFLRDGSVFCGRCREVSWFEEIVCVLAKHGDEAVGIVRVFCGEDDWAVTRGSFSNGLCSGVGDDGEF